jgi:hypothetical protein
MDDRAIRLTREELYEKVWSRPMRSLAKEWGISDVGLAKICKVVPQLWGINFGKGKREAIWTLRFLASSSRRVLKIDSRD